MTPDRITRLRNETYHEIGEAQIQLIKAAPDPKLEKIALARLHLLQDSLIELDQIERRQQRRRGDYLNSSEANNDAETNDANDKGPDSPIRNAQTQSLKPAI